MTETSIRPTAKIYQFPRGGRASLHGARLVKQAAAIMPVGRYGRVEFGANWYHEAAIQDSEGMRRR
ncbi:MAG: DUF2735 domain-containing protein [Hyphomicrobium sp.]|jgi:uncharacterized protein DUF2735